MRMSIENGFMTMSYHFFQNFFRSQCLFQNYVNYNILVNSEMEYEGERTFWNWLVNLWFMHIKIGKLSRQSF